MLTARIIFAILAIRQTFPGTDFVAVSQCWRHDVLPSTIIVAGLSEHYSFSNGLPFVVAGVHSLFIAEKEHTASSLHTVAWCQESVPESLTKGLTQSCDPCVQCVLSLFVFGEFFMRLASKAFLPGSLKILLTPP
jgi:hypothetical protein